jgi:hypothetical protein
MSHNTSGALAVLALGLSCSVAFGQEANLGGAASSQVSLGASTEAGAQASSTGSADGSAPAVAGTSGTAATSGQVAAESEASEAPATTETGQWLAQLLPVDGMGEIGLAVGLLVPSWRHNFHLEDRPHQHIHAAPELALRGAWFPIRFAGAELEGAAGATITGDGKGAYPWSFRVSAIGQVPLWRVTPFGMFGFGRMGNLSKPMGDDGDPLFHVGVGAKAFLTELFAVRADLRDNLTQRKGSTDGMLTHSVELLVGASLTLGR